MRNAERLCKLKIKNDTGENQNTLEIYWKPEFLFPANASKEGERVVASSKGNKSLGKIFYRVLARTTSPLKESLGRHQILFVIGTHSAMLTFSVLDQLQIEAMYVSTSGGRRDAFQD